jgi:hypothetical protein
VVERFKKKISRITIVREVIKEKSGYNKKLLSGLFLTACSLVYYRSSLDAKNALLKPAFDALHEKNPWYGHRRIAWDIKLGFKRARRLMKAFAITAKTSIAKRFVKPDDRNVPDTKIKNLAKGRSPIRPNAVCRSDFTHIIYYGRHLYLATVIDAFTRERYWGIPSRTSIRRNSCSRRLPWLWCVRTLRRKYSTATREANTEAFSFLISS